MCDRASGDIPFGLPVFSRSPIINRTSPPSLLPSFSCELQVAIIGGGSFGLAMASIVGKKGIPTCILVRKEEVREWVDGWEGGREGEATVGNRRREGYGCWHISSSAGTDVLDRHITSHEQLAVLLLYHSCSYTQVAAHINAHHSHPQYLSDLRLVNTITSSADPKVRTEEGRQEGR